MVTDNRRFSPALCRTRDRAEGIIIGMFGAYDGLESPYLQFQGALLTEDALDSLRAQKDFKNGVQIVVNMEDSLRHNKTGFEEYFLGSAMHDGNEEDLRAVRKLLEALSLLEAKPECYEYHDLDEDDVADLRQDLETIVYAIEMVLKVKRSEQKLVAA